VASMMASLLWRLVPVAPRFWSLKAGADDLLP
jgi:hypothetical protein